MKKILFVLIAGLFAVMVIGCSKTEELAAVMEVTVKYYDANQNLQTLPDYQVILTQSVENAPSYVAFREGTTDKDGKCRFEFKSGELTEFNQIEGNYLDAYIVVLDPATNTPVGSISFYLPLGETLYVFVIADLEN